MKRITIGQVSSFCPSLKVAAHISSKCKVNKQLRWLHLMMFYIMVKTFWKIE